MRRIILVSVSLLIAGCWQQGQTVDRSRIEAATEASQSMAERFNAADPAGDPPRMTDPAVARDLAALYDLDYLSQLGTLPIDQTAALGEWNAAGAATGLAYLLWGSGKTTPPDIMADDALLERMAANTIEYRDEIGPYLDFTMYVTETMARSTAAYLETLSDADREQPETMAAAAQVRSGFAHVISGTIDLFETPGVAEDWLVARLPALKATSMTAASFLEAEAWSELASRARTIAERTSNPEIAAGLNEFAG